ncbi:MAG: transposase [Saprospirales bacterium]|nr:MAG: transposase [Saprospirales bacterium]
MFKYSQKYYLYDKAVDMRKSFFTLGAIVVNQMQLKLLSGSSFIFINKRKTHLKMLTWEGDGFSLYYKRLEKGTFEHPEGGSDYLISHEKLMLILAGIETKKIVKRRRISL